MVDIESLQALCRAANESRRLMMGLYSSGPFSRVSFVFTRYGVEMRTGVRRLERTGSLVATIQCEV